jgi:hypothetical protein
MNLKIQFLYRLFDDEMEISQKGDLFQIRNRSIFLIIDFDNLENTYFFCVRESRKSFYNLSDYFSDKRSILRI